MFSTFFSHARYLERLLTDVDENWHSVEAT